MAVSLPNTDYLEIESAHVGATFAVWVTRPVGYESAGSARYPAIYATDGNWLAGLLSPLAELTAFDRLEEFPPYLQVTVGYVPADLTQWHLLRVRDLIPPGEPLSASTSEAIAAEVESAGLSAAERKGVLEIFENTRADRFLRFLEEELRPQIEDRYRVEPGSAGLFGFSYGGLFTLYALFEGRGMFSRFGAGSPGVMTPESEIFRLQREASESGRSFGGARLHITVNERELLGKTPAYRDHCIQAVHLIDEIYRGDQKELVVSGRVLPGDTHATGTTQAFVSFLQQFYGR
ncbi:MAG TPA: alpha/beta hydrolase-fold protein [Solirubrobacterales bacterium]|nr:alpha/beta hydrolase-fold protein [Solirubrobacterales bacterium]